MSTLRGGEVAAGRSSLRGGGVAASIPLLGNDSEPTIFELSANQRSSCSFRTTGIEDYPLDKFIPKKHLREDEVQLPQVSERDLVAHFTRLTHRQYSVDLGAYPLGSCTMKYNPKLCDAVANMPSFANIHPGAPSSAIQGWLEVLVRLEEILCEVTGMYCATLQPAAGAAGELTGLLLMRAFHDSNGDNRTHIIIPDSAHGTNPASVTLGGYLVTTVPTDSRGCVDVSSVKKVAGSNIAGIMLTNPNTLGIFEEEIVEIAQLIHGCGGLLYYDGANFNAIMGKVRPGDMGFDIVHLNLHKTFATPHGGGGPGAGPVVVSKRLAKFLPGPRPVRIADRERSLVKTNSDPEHSHSSQVYGWEMPESSIGRVHSWHGNSLVLARALAYILYNGSDGLKHASEMAVLNANWLRKRLSSNYDVAFDRTCMHELVLTLTKFKKDFGVRAIDVAKRLMELGFHAPTIYFPLIVDEALMIEPTETESLQTLESLAGALDQIAEEAREVGASSKFHEYPSTTPVGRVDEALAARQLIPTYDAKH